MKAFPIELADVRGIIVAVVLPVIPLVGSQVPLKTVLKVLLKALV